MRIVESMLAVVLLFVASIVPERPQEAPQEKPASAPTKTHSPKEILKSLIGEWEGTCQTWLRPGQLYDDAKIKGEFNAILNGQFVRHIYEGTMKGKPRKGEETIVFNSIAKKFQISWFDEFHMPYGILFSEGPATANGFELSAEYDIGPGTPKWGWKTVYEVIDADHITITSWNIKPGDQPAKAVETKYTRVKK